MRRLWVFGYFRLQAIPVKACTLVPRPLNRLRPGCRKDPSQEIEPRYLGCYKMAEFSTLSQ